MTVTDQELITEIKTRLSITGNYHDSLLLAYANDVKEYMLSAGVEPITINDSKSIGAITIGVNDLWVNKSWSTAFFQRVIQLKLLADSTEEEAFDVMTTEDIDECVQCLESEV